VNPSLGSLRFAILVCSASGVLIGRRRGAWLSPWVPDRLLTTLFALCMLGIGTVYVLAAGQALLGLSCNGALESAMTEQPEEGAYPSHPGRPAVAVRDLWMTFPGPQAGKEVHVLERINMEVARGEFVCLVGPSGCGKTTLLNLIAGFLPATRGEVLVEGSPVHGPDPRRIFIFQEGGIFPWLTVRDNVAFGLAHKNKAEREPIVAHYLDMVGLTGFAGAYPRELSGGMRQRVEIGRCEPTWCESGSKSERRSCLSPTISTKPFSWPTALWSSAPDLPRFNWSSRSTNPGRATRMLPPTCRRAPASSRPWASGFAMGQG
jgi:hypothetical protein